MSPETKALWDVILTVVAMAGAIAAFVIGLMQWRRGQAWQRAEQLDKFVVKFESDELLKLASVILDWTDRTVTFRGQPFKVRNAEVLLAAALCRLYRAQFLTGSRQHRDRRVPAVC